MCASLLILFIWETNNIFLLYRNPNGISQINHMIFKTKRKKSWEKHDFVCESVNQCHSIYSNYDSRSTFSGYNSLIKTKSDLYRKCLLINWIIEWSFYFFTLSFYLQIHLHLLTHFLQWKDWSPKVSQINITLIHLHRSRNVSYQHHHTQISLVRVCWVKIYQPLQLECNRMVNYQRIIVICL